MNQIESLEQELKKRFRGATTSIDAPDNPHGEYFLNIALDSKTLTISWAEDVGFGLYAEDAGLYEGPERVTRSEQEVIDCIKERLDAE